MSLTTSSILQSLTSTNSSLIDFATPTILSVTLRRPDFSAGPPGISLIILVMPSSEDRIAPMPSSEAFKFISQSS